MITPIIKNEGKTVVFGPCRLSYTHLFSKYSPDGDPDNGKFMAILLGIAIHGFRSNDNK